jgi:hypothetical protein
LRIEDGKRIGNLSAGGHAGLAPIRVAIEDRQPKARK